MSLNGIWMSEDKGLWYIREIGNKVWWFAETNHVTASYVFYGVRNANLVTGDFVSVPKGTATTCGTSVAQVLSETQLSIRAQVGATSSTVILTKVPYDPVEHMGPQLPSWRTCLPGFALENMTGVWLADDFSKYYLRQIGDNVWWVGEHLRGSHCNVFRGTLKNGNLIGEWADVPKCSASGYGTLNLETDSSMMEKTNSIGGFGAELWSKAKVMTVKVALSSLCVEAQNEETYWFNTGPTEDEPYLWPFYFTVGGLPTDEEVPIAPSRPAFLYLRDPIPVGDSGISDLKIGGAHRLDSIPIPDSIGKSAFCLTTVRLPDVNLAKASTFLGVVVVALEHDVTFPRNMAVARTVIRDGLRFSLREAIRTFHGLDGGEMKRKLTGAIANALAKVSPVMDKMSSWSRDDDDVIGANSALFSFSELEGHSSIPFTLRCYGGYEGTYSISGSVEKTH